MPFQSAFYCNSGSEEEVRETTPGIFKKAVRQHRRTNSPSYYPAHFAHKLILVCPKDACGRYLQGNLVHTKKKFQQFVLLTTLKTVKIHCFIGKVMNCNSYCPVQSNFFMHRYSNNLIMALRNFWQRNTDCLHACEAIHQKGQPSIMDPDI